MTTATVHPPRSTGDAFTLTVTGMARCRDAAYERREWPMVIASGRLLVAAHELLRDGMVGDRAQQIGASLAACGHRQPTLLATRGLRVNLNRGARRISRQVDLHAARMLTHAAQWECLWGCVQPTHAAESRCQCIVCAVTARLSRPATSAT